VWRFNVLGADRCSLPQIGADYCPKTFVLNLYRLCGFLFWKWVNSTKVGDNDDDKGRGAPRVGGTRDTVTNRILPRYY